MLVIADVMPKNKSAGYDNWRFLVTSSCNSHCFFCHGDGTGEKQGQFLKLGLFESILARYSKEIKKIRFAGGEPFLHPEIFRMVKAALEITPNVSVGTNGLLLNKIYRQIIDSGLSKLTISLHSLHPDTFEVITKTPLREFLSILDSISKLKKHLQIKINYVVLNGINSTGREINDMLDYVVGNKLNIEFEELDLGSLRAINFLQFHRDPQKVVKTISKLKDVSFEYNESESVWISKISTSSVGVQKCHCFHSLCKRCLRSRPILVYPAGAVNRCRLGEPRIKNLDISL